MLEVQVKKEIWKIRLHFETKKVSGLSVKFTRAPASVAASNFGAKLCFFFSLTVKQITFSLNKCNSFTFRCISVVIFASKVCKKMRVSQTVHDIVGYQVSDLIS